LLWWQLPCTLHILSRREWLQALADWEKQVGRAGLNAHSDIYRSGLGRLDFLEIDTDPNCTLC